MYSSARGSVNVAWPWTTLVWCLAAAIALAHCSGETSSPGRDPRSCTAMPAGLFTPPVPQLGEYEVCATAAALIELVQPGWTIESLPPLDVFGAAGLYDRGRLARLYGGRRANVARGWIREGGRFESVTLISPHPDRALQRLEPGTLVIRHVIIR